MIEVSYKALIESDGNTQGKKSSHWSPSLQRLKK